MAAEGRPGRTVWQDGYNWRSGADSAGSVTCSGPSAVREDFGTFWAWRNADPCVGTAVDNALSARGSSAFVRPRWSGGRGSSRIRTAKRPAWQQGAAALPAPPGSGLPGSSGFDTTQVKKDLKHFPAEA